MNSLHSFFIKNQANVKLDHLQFDGSYKLEIDNISIYFPSKWEIYDFAHRVSKECFQVDFPHTFEQVRNYLLNISDPDRINKGWMEGYVCGLTTAGGISDEVENEILKWISTL